MRLKKEVEVRAYRAPREVPELSSTSRRLSPEDVRSVVQAVHVLPETAGGWEVRKGGRRRVVKHFETKEAAVSFAEKLTKGGLDLYVHDRPPGTT